MVDYATYVAQSSAADGMLVKTALLAILFTLIGTTLSHDTGLARWVRRGSVKPIRLKLSWILTIGLLIRLPNLLDSFWYDETFSGAVASLPFHKMAPVILSDVHPPLPYLVEWLTLHLLGSSEAALRLPSLIFGLVSIWVLFRLAWTVVDQQVALVAALMVALLPVHIYYSNEARGYALLLLGVWWALWAITAFKPRRFILAGLLPLIHAQGFIYLVVLIFSALIHWRGRYRRVIMLALFPGAWWLPVALQQSKDVADGFWLRPVTLGQVVAYIWNSTTGGIGQPYITLAVLVVLSAASFAGLRLLLRWSSRFLPYRLWSWLPIADVFLLVPLITLAISVNFHTIWLSRALMPAGMLIVIPWALLVVHGEYQRYWRWAMGLSLAVTLVSAMPWNSQRIDLRSVYSACGDYPIYVTSTAMGVSASYYSDGPVYVWQGSDDLNQWLNSGAKEALGFRIVASAQEVPQPFCFPMALNPMVDLEGRKAIARAKPKQQPLVTIESLYFAYATYVIRGA